MGANPNYVRIHGLAPNLQLLLIPSKILKI